MEVVLEQLTPADQPLLWVFLYHAIFVPEAENPPEPDVVYRPELSRYAQEWGRPDDTGFVAREITGRKPVGATWLRLWVGEEKGYGYVEDTIPELTLAVLPEYRGQGVGNLLLRRLLEAAAQQFPAVSLSVSAENPAIRLYRRFGFVEVRLDGGSWVMRKDLRR